ncbi:hypothetical protein D0C36_13995 [Mucilaginibacter conchicola]|uniref:Carboxypeptidase-like regulatory domain-containing protein n=1 Tax=Mucilaginibacter conchicola TaxID=2303333 RepID=A0A372NTD2_9SPHI|nr:hypothetical protein [Mucilaginibacter conchicola]RFZ92533.1 hypothetical protein D0C36_13995 [Mucilaginibacter conchicola]
MKLWLTSVFLMLCFTGFAQSTVSGIVFDKNSNARIARVSVTNLTSGKSVYNTFKGEFEIQAKPGDRLAFVQTEHFGDTITVNNYESMAVYLKPVAIQLMEVTVKGKNTTPEKQLEKTKQEYSKIYGSTANADLLSLGSGGVGLSIDALYNAFSKSGRNAEKLRGIIDAEYKQKVIDYRFNKAFVQGITHLEEPKLTDFMQKYRPGYYLVTTAGDYEFISYIRTNLKRYLRRPRSYEVAPLPEIKLDVN